MQKQEEILSKFHEEVLNDPYIKAIHERIREVVEFGVGSAGLLEGLFNLVETRKQTIADSFGVKITQDSLLNNK